jgi:hypothetical protein
MIADSMAGGQHVTVISHVAVEELFDGCEFFVNEITELNVGYVCQRVSLNFPAEIVRIQRRADVYLLMPFLAQLNTAHARIVDKIFHQFNACKQLR